MGVGESERVGEGANEIIRSEDHGERQSETGAAKKGELRSNAERGAAAAVLSLHCSPLTLPLLLLSLVVGDSDARFLPSSSQALCVRQTVAVDHALTICPVALSPSLPFTE